MEVRRSFESRHSIHSIHSSDAAPTADTPHIAEAASPPKPNNRLLGALPEVVRVGLARYLEPITLNAGERLGSPHEHIPFVYFPESGVASIIKRMRDGAELEVGTIGREGMTGLAVFLGGDEMPTECVVQIAGAAQRIHAEALQAVSREPGPLRDVLLCYTQYMFDQTGQSVACSALHTVEQRCARWLLTTRDRVGDDSFAMTHEHLSTLLGVRRAGVTSVAESLRRAGAIAYTRGVIRVVDADALEVVACECYREVREDFERLLGRATRRMS